MFIYFFLGLLFLWLGGVTYVLFKLSSHYQRLTAGTDRKTLKEILDKILFEVEREKEKSEELVQEIGHLSEEIVHHVQKVGIVRFNPFADTGGDQSFVLAILDGKDTGIVLTSLHNRGITRWYAKNVQEGKGVDHELSNEEQKSIHLAGNVYLEEKKGKKKQKV